MKITFLVVGKTNHSSLIQLQEEYQNRLKHYISFETITIPELKNTKNISESEQKEKEADLILKQLEAADEVILLDEKGNILFGLTLLTNIHHIKSDGIATMSILDTYDERCQQFICVDGKSLPNADAPAASLSNREIEVLRLLASGHSSKQIAAELNLSVKTVDNHRQNLLRKTNNKNTGELVAYGINMGFI
mgnify:CR=1 FL=1